MYDMLTVYPGIANQDSAFGQLELCNFSLDAFILQSNLLNQNDLLPISRTVHIGTKSEVAFHPLLSKIDNGFMEFVLPRSSAYSRRSESRPRDLGGHLQYCGYSSL